VLELPPLLSEPGAGEPNPPPSLGAPQATAAANITAPSAPIAGLSSLFMELLDLTVSFDRFVAKLLTNMAPIQVNDLPTRIKLAPTECFAVSFRADSSEPLFAPRAS
jgi:hypothetical protein